MSKLKLKIGEMQAGDVVFEDGMHIATLVSDPVRTETGWSIHDAISGETLGLSDALANQDFDVERN